MREGRPRTRPLVGALVVAAALAAPGSALANSPLTGIPSGTTSTPATTTTATVTTATATPVASATANGGGLNTIEKLGIGVAVLALFGSIAYVIRSDARLHVSSRATIDIDRERATVRPRAERVKSSRAKAKAARRARRARRAGR
jgi:hypothetical protein